jgi:hypothetical protein
MDPDARIARAYHGRQLILCEVNAVFGQYGIGASIVRIDFPMPLKLIKRSCREAASLSSSCACAFVRRADSASSN